MYVKYITLDGFKSYARETIIGPLDKNFNAITGLEGTGKSAILDAVYFVLGLETSTSSADEAEKMEDLFSRTKYQDDAVNKTAKVSILFDNTDKEEGECPKGYESYDEIIISRMVEQRASDNKEKEILSQYHLNGATAEKSVVTDLLKSVDWDLNHPHVLIRASKIMQVVKMKPKELLQLIHGDLCVGLIQEGRQAVSSLELEDSIRELTMSESWLKKKLLRQLKVIRKLRQVAANVGFNVPEDILSQIKLNVEKYLTMKRRIEKIRETVETLRNKYDDRMKDIMQKTYKYINNELDLTMKALWNGSSAKVVPASPSINKEDGAAIHVSLCDGLWKESLEELNGEQQSLVALALLLAVSICGPATFFMLDDIEAGLDVNQTSNLGLLIKEKYSDVQLICISSKEEMFNKANALFTTTIEHGISKVTRICSEGPTRKRKHSNP